MRKGQKKRLKAAQKNARNNGGQVKWKNGRPMVVGGRRAPSMSVDPGTYLKLKNPIPVDSIFEKPEEQNADNAANANDEYDTTELELHPHDHESE